MTVRAGVDGITGELFVRLARSDRSVEHLLKFDVERTNRCGGGFCFCLAVGELGEPVGPGRVVGCTCNEGFANDDLGIGKRLLGPLEQGVEAGFIRFDGAFVFAAEGDGMPVVVDTDHDRQDVGFELDAVAVPACIEVGNLVTGDASVVDFEVFVRVLREQVVAYQLSVAATECLEIVGLADLFVAPRVSDR
jgi:hypothetical protein